VPKHDSILAYDSQNDKWIQSAQIYRDKRNMQKTVITVLGVGMGLLLAGLGGLYYKVNTLQAEMVELDVRDELLSLEAKVNSLMEPELLVEEEPKTIEDRVADLERALGDGEDHAENGGVSEVVNVLYEEVKQLKAAQSSEVEPE
jgi:Na+-transporting NADH:ubiquinone oxidoreductase subunit NqrC